MLYRVVFQEILRKDYEMQLDKLQVVMSFVMAPWDFKVLYGIVCDTVRIPFVKSF